jgi:hypothetical protein
MSLLGEGTLKYQMKSTYLHSLTRKFTLTQKRKMAILV